MLLRLTKIDEFQFLTCFKHQVWGSKTARFKNWKVGDYLVLTVGKAIAGLAQVSGSPYISKQIVWDNGVFPHRIPLKFLYVFLAENRLPILGSIRETLTSIWGPSYGWGLLNQQLVEGNPAEIIIKNITSRQSNLSEIKAQLDHYLNDAKLQRDTVSNVKHRNRGKPRRIIKEEKGQGEIISARDESGHTKIQNALIRLGKVSGCSVWIASNDRNRQYRGKPLGEGCLKKLPNLGLSEEATRRISLIDVIWLRQNAPVCAFEVETSTQIYSGLLRMSDLLSVVPALNIKLFIVAPRDRQTKFIAELSRPTFRKIGLSEFSRFIPSEDLESLLAKVGDLQGHIQPSVLEKIAFELDEEIETSLQ